MSESASGLLPVFILAQQLWSYRTCFTTMCS